MKDVKKINKIAGIAIFIFLLGFIFISCITEPEPDKLETLTGDVSIIPGAGLFTGQTLTATYSGPETVFYQWLFNGTVINGANTNMYTPAEAGNYAVIVAASGFFSKTSSAVFVDNAPLTFTPVAGDFIVTNANQTAGSVTAVGVNAILGKTTGTITILYGDSKSNVPPQTAGTYPIYINVTAAGDYEAITELLLNTSLNVGFMTFGIGDFNVFGEEFHFENEVEPVLVTWSRSEPITISYRGINNTTYNKNIVVPQDAGEYEVIIDIAATGFFQAISNFSVFTFTVVEQGDSDVTFIIWSQITDLAQDIITDAAIYKIPGTGNSSAWTFTLPGELAEYDNIQWYINGALDNSANNSLTYTVNAADHGVGTRTIAVRIVIDGNIYNKTVYFDVFMY